MLIKGSTIELKLARLADARQIALMSRELVEAGLRWSWTSARVAACIRASESNVLTAWAEGHLIGFALMQFFDEHAHLNLLAVAPAYRHAGIGRQLIEWLEDTARVGGILLVQLEVRAENGSARAFYRQLGYQETGSIPGYYGGQEAAIRMVHDLRTRIQDSTTVLPPIGFSVDRRWT